MDKNPSIASMAKNPSYGEKIFKMLSMTKIHFTELKLLEVLQQYSMAGTNLPWPGQIFHGQKFFKGAYRA